MGFANLKEMTERRFLLNFTLVPTPHRNPLIGALDAAGKYYSRTDDKGPWSTTPGQAGGSDPACQQSYTILMTDGYYGDSISGIGNSDNTAGSKITGPNNQSYTYQPAARFVITTRIHWLMSP